MTRTDRDRWTNDTRRARRIVTGEADVAKLKGRPRSHMIEQKVAVALILIGEGSAGSEFDRLSS